VTNETVDDLRPMCDRVTQYAIEHTGGKCPRRSLYKYVHRQTEEVRHRCAIHPTYALGWSRFKLGKDGKALPPGSRRSNGNG
jgi:hypothetical protein